MIISIKLHIKKNVDFLLRLRSPRYRQTPMHHIRVKAHAVFLRREHQLLLLVLYEIWRFRVSKNQKLMLYLYMSFLTILFLQPIGIYCFKGYTLEYRIDDFIYYFVKKNLCLILPNRRFTSRSILPVRIWHLTRLGFEKMKPSTISSDKG